MKEQPGFPKRGGAGKHTFFRPNETEPPQLDCRGGGPAFAAVLFGWEVFLYQTAEEPFLSLPAFVGYSAGFWALSLATAAACLIQVQLPLWVNRGVSWGLLLLLPLGFFLAVDLINSTQVLHFSFLKGLANTCAT